MTSEERDAIISRAVGKWGEDHQMLKAAEEASEFCTELLHNLGGRDNDAKVMEELVDNIVTSLQVIKIFGWEDVIEDEVDRGLRSLDKRILEEEA